MAPLILIRLERRPNGGVALRVRLLLYSLSFSPSPSPPPPISLASRAMKNQLTLAVRALRRQPCQSGTPPDMMKQEKSVFVEPLHLSYKSYIRTLNSSTVEPLSKDTPDLSKIAILACCVFFMVVTSCKSHEICKVKPSLSTKL